MPKAAVALASAAFGESRFGEVQPLADAPVLGARLPLKLAAVREFTGLGRATALLFIIDAPPVLESTAELIPRSKRKQRPSTSRARLPKQKG